MRQLLTIIFFFLAAGTQAQSLITGAVKDQKNNPVPSANVSLKSTYDGTTTDSSGNFSFRSGEKGQQVLVISAIGYKIAELPLNLDAALAPFQIELKEEISEMKAVVITAGTFEASDKKKGSVLSPIDILTTASANADVTGAIKTLPGAQQVGESEGLFVRGGTASETRTYIDGTLVNNFFYSSVPNISQRGRFSPWILKGTVFSSGGYSALYGQALSAALILETVDLPETSSGTINFSPISASIGYQHLAKNKRSSWGFSYGYTNVKLAFAVLKTLPDYFITPQFHTGDANFRIKTSKTGILKYYGYFSGQRVGLRNPSLDTLGFNEAFNLRNFNMYHNLSWKENLANRWKFNGGISYSNNLDKIRGALQDESNQEELVSGFENKNFLLHGEGQYINAKAVWEKRFHGLSALRFGSEWNHSDDKTDITRYNGQQYPIRVREDLVAGFAETDVYLTNALAAKLGTRVEHSKLVDRTNIAPRISLAYQLGKESQASFAYGIFYQDPERKYLPSTTGLVFSKATHYILQYQKITSQQTVRAELFYKKYQDLVKTVVVNNRESAASNKGSGYARGFELFYRDRKSIRNVDYWISYSYLDTKRDFLNYPTELQPSFAAKHTANLVVKKFISKLKTQFNANYVFASGRPYYNIRYDNSGGKFNIYDQGKTIPYNSLSLSVNYLPNIFKQGAGKYTVLVLSVTNVLGSRQVFGYNYSYNGYRKEPILPSPKTFVYVGAFISFGVDRSQDAINNNL